MGEMITKPDANPILLALLNFLLLGGVGYLIIGQQKKAIISIVATLVGSMFCLGFIIPIITAIDAYKLGEKLQTGASIGENENGLDFLDAIFKD